MKELSLPITLLGILALALAFFFYPGVEGKKIQPKKVITMDFNQLKTVDDAEKALDKGSFKDTIAMLEPLRKFNDLRVIFMLTEAYARVGSYSASYTVILENEASKNRSLGLVFRLAKIYEFGGNLKKAKGLYQELAKAQLPPSLKSQVTTRLGTVSLTVKDYSSALESYKFLAKDNPKNTGHFIDLFNLLTKNSQLAQIEYYRKTGDLYHGNDYQYNLCLGKIYFDAGIDEKAIETLKKASSINPDQLLPRHLLFKLYGKLKKDLEALEELGKIVSGSQSLPATILTAKLYFESALLAKSLNRLDLASKFIFPAFLIDLSLGGRDDKGTLRDVEKFVATSGSDEEKKFMRVFLDYANGDYALAKRAMIAALPSLKDRRLQAGGQRLIEECEKIIKADEAYCLFVAKIEGKKDGKKVKTSPAKPVSAKVPADKVPTSGISETKPHSQTFSQTDATASTSVSQPIQTVLVQPLPEKAQTTSSPVPSNPTTQPTPQAGMTAKIEQIIGTARESPQDASVQFLCAVQLQRFKDTENAKLLFKETIALEPEFAEAYYNLAQIYQNEGNLQEAVSFLESAVKANPDNSKFKSVLANILMDRGDISEASALAKSSAELDPNNSEGHFALARVYYASKRHQEALDAIAKGFEIESQAPTQIYQSLNELRNQVKSEMVSH